ncbi:MAG: S9 family peptidase, partial [Prevotella sp.]|nr:S9 family peptidase [Prevotella sp.]
MKKSFFAVILALISASAMAKDIKIERFRYAGPYEMRAPLMLDSVSLDSKQFKTESLLETPLKLDLVKSAKVVEDTVFSHSATPSLHLLGFQVQNSAFAKTKISVKGLKNYHLYLDGSKIGGGETQLQPGTHEFVIKFLTEKAGSDTVRVKISTDADLTADAVTGKRLLTLNDLYDGLRIGDLSLSPDG